MIARIYQGEYWPDDARCQGFSPDKGLQDLEIGDLVEFYRDAKKRFDESEVNSGNLESVYSNSFLIAHSLMAQRTGMIYSVTNVAMNVDGSIFSCARQSSRQGTSTQ